jgi:hypothetical protein
MTGFQKCWLNRDERLKENAMNGVVFTNISTRVVIRDLRIQVQCLGVRREEEGNSETKSLN